MVEGARLESVYTRKGIAGSNPALSANANTIVPSLWLGIFYDPTANRACLGEREGNKKPRDARYCCICV